MILKLLAISMFTDESRSGTCRTQAMAVLSKCRRRIASILPKIVAGPVLICQNSVSGASKLMTLRLDITTVRESEHNERGST